VVVVVWTIGTRGRGDHNSAMLPSACPQDRSGLGGGRARRMRPVRRLSPSAVALVVLGTAAALTMAVVLIPQVRFG
jgi:hypothetical protein